jgi:CRISPR-associated endoribonuclease Cas6
MDLISLVLTLRPLPTNRPADSWPDWWARAAHALVLDLVQQVDPGRAARLHDDQGVRPFTVSTLMGRFAGRVPVPEEAFALRLTGFEPGLSELLCAAAEPGGQLAPAATIELDFCPFRVESVRTADHPWARQADFAEIATAALAGDPARQVTLQLTSPTTFKSGGRHQPLPLPELVIGSLLERWNAFAPVGFPPEVRRYAQECLAVNRYSLRTRPVPVKGGGLRMGAVGQITYTTLNYDRYWMGVVQALAAFSLFSGIGAGTTNGLGQARRL